MKENGIKSGYLFGDFEFDVGRRRLLKNGEPVALQPKALDVLLALIERHGEPVSKTDLMDIVWPDQFVEEKNLSVQIAALRKTFGESKNEHKFIVTIPGVGYTFVAEVKAKSHDKPIVTVSETQSHDRREADVAASRSDFRRNLALVAGALVIVLLVGSYAWLTRSRPAVDTAATQGVSSIAVLPFQFLNNADQSDGLELGLTESLINHLSSLKNVSIRPVSAVKKYTQENRDLAQISAELRVDSVLEGYIQKDGNRLRLTIRLLNTKNGLSIWNEQIDEDLADIFAVQDKISTRIVNSLQIALSDRERRELAKVYTENAAAYKKYLTGRHHWNKRNPQGFAESIKFYNQAIDLDPTFALAYAGLADTYLLIGLYNIEPTTEAFPKARAAAAKALEIDRELGEAEADLAMIENLFHYNWAAAEQHFTRAVELKPSYSTGRHWFGIFLAMQGRTDDAIRELSQARDLDPLSPSIGTDLGFAYYLAGQNDQATEQFNKILKGEPDFANAHNMLGMNYLARKSYESALGEFEAANRLSQGTFGLVELVWATGFAGDREKARQLFAALPDDKKRSPFDLAIIHTSFGEKEKAIEYLNLAYEKRDPQIVPIKVFPPFETLRQEPGFIDLLRKMNLGPA